MGLFNAKNQKPKKKVKILSRKFLAISLGAAIFATIGPASIISPEANANEEIVVVCYGGRYRDAVEKAYIKPFIKETGINVVISDTPDLAKAKAQVETGNVIWDVFDAIGSFATNGAKYGLWEPLDTSIVDLSDMIIKPEKTYVPWYLWHGGIAWDPKRFPSKHPTNFKELWDVEKFPGKRTFRARPFEMLEMALLADGVPPDKLYPLDVDRAFKVCDRIRPFIPKFCKATTQTIELLRTKEVDYSYTYSGRALSAKDQGVSIDFSFAQTVIGTEYLTVLKGTKHREAAMKYVNFCLRPDRQAHFAELFYYNPTVKGGYDLVPQRIKKYFPDPNNPNHVVLNDKWWQPHYDKIYERFQEWMMK